MNVADFNQWRANYDSLSYTDQVEFYNRVALDHPLQQGFDVTAFSKFFTRVARAYNKISVIEFGGWKGELASRIIPRFPSIVDWRNYEISQTAIEKTVCRNEAYQAIVLPDFIWNLSLGPALVFISSHSIEHIKEWQLKLMLSRLPETIKFVGLQAPLGDKGTDWGDYYGSHILECGWQRVIEILDNLNFQLFMEQNEFKGFERKRHNAGLE